MAYFRCGGGVPSSVKTLPTYKTASGSVATFETDMTENLISCVCEIQYSQASGTPSPVNPLPITTYTEMNVSHSGKNLLNLDRTHIVTSGAYSNVSPRTFTNNDIWVGLTRGNYFNNSLINSYSYTSNSVVVNAVNNAYGLGFPIQCKPNTKYVVSTSNNVNLQFGFYDKSGNPLSNTQNQSFTTPNNCFWLVVLFTSVANTDTTYTNPQLELGSTATTYEAYNGTTANIPFGQTVANGVLDIGSGKLRVTDGYVDLGSLTWTKSAGFFYANLAHKKAPSANVAFNAICSEYPIVSQSVWASNDKSVWDYTTSNDELICVIDSTYNNSTASDFKTAMNGVQLVYELETPIEIQLDSITLQALLNENNIWCDTNGDTTAKYILSVGEALRQS